MSATRNSFYGPLGGDAQAGLFGRLNSGLHPSRYGQNFEIHFYPRASPYAPRLASVNFNSPWPATRNPCRRERLDASTEHPTDTFTETKDLERVSAEQQLLQQVIQ